MPIILSDVPFKCNLLQFSLCLALHTFINKASAGVTDPEIVICCYSSMLCNTA